MNNKKMRLFTLVLMFIAALAVRADKVDDYVKAEMQKQHVPGISIAVLKDGKPLKVEGYGLANVELNVPARPDTVYKIGSVSKQFIAAGVLILIQDGKVTFDDRVSKFLDGTPDTWKDITVRHILTHTSGIVREGPGFDPLKIQRDADVIKTAYPLPMRFAPGEKWEYCNVGYFILAEIINKVSGKPWGDFLTERVFSPLEMSSTRTTDMTAIVQNRADGYGWVNGKVQNAAIYLALRPSGAFLSSALDLAKWDAALYTDKILKQSIRDQMWSGVKLNNGTTHPYGFGWELDTIGSHRLVHHGGTLPGFRAEIARFVDDKLTVVVLTNGNNAEPGPLSLGIAEHYIPDLFPKRTIAKIDPKILDSYVGQYQAGGQDLILNVVREGDKLMMQFGLTAEKRELFPQNETTFFTNENRRQIYNFAKDEKGQVAYLVVTTDTREVGRAKKIK